MGFHNKKLSLREAFNAQTKNEETVFVFDLDCALIDTRPLYEQMLHNAARLLTERTDMSYEDAIDATHDALKQYNGYVREAFWDRYEIPSDETIQAVYDPDTMDMSLIQAPPHITDMLSSIKGKIYLYTNSSEGYGRSVLRALGIDQYFAGIYGTDTLGYLRKPDPQSFQMFMKDTGAKPENIWFFEDSLDNLQTAQDMGWNTVFVTEFLAGNLHDKTRQNIDIEVNIVMGSLSELTRPAQSEHPSYNCTHKPS